MSEQHPAIDNTPVEKEINFLGRLVGVFTSPGAAFQSIARKPGWVIPLLVLIALNLGYMFVLQPVLVNEQQQKTKQSLEEKNVDSEQQEVILTQSAKWMKITMLPIGAISMFIVVLITAGVWLFFSNTVLGGTANYKQLLSVVTYTSYIGFVGQLIKLPINLTQETMNVHFSLATFMSDDLLKTFLYKFLASVELFNIWTVIALSIGIAVVAKLNTKKVWPVVAIVYLVFFVGSAALGSKFG